MGGKQGRLITSNQRQMALEWILVAVKGGASLKRACKILGISRRTLQYWKKNGLTDKRQIVSKIPRNKLSDAERKEVLGYCNCGEFSDMSPSQIVPTLADRGIYIASESSFYRILREAGLLKHRGSSKEPVKRAKPKAYIATSANQIWSWDITYLASDIKGVFYYLYLIMDIYSRKIVGWEVYETQTAEQASLVLRKARLNESIAINNEIVLHSDNGSPMKGATMLATMQQLGVIPSFSRPSVSNDNPFSESVFKTLKYVPAYPKNHFGSIDEARQWVAKFTDWYNNRHLHSNISFVTPSQRHDGGDIAILAKRNLVYQVAKEKNPARWAGDTRNWDHKASVSLNPDNDDTLTH